MLKICKNVYVYAKKKSKTLKIHYAIRTNYSSKLNKVILKQSKNSITRFNATNSKLKLLKIRYASYAKNK
jgi:hypothetical protein